MAIFFTLLLRVIVFIVFFVVVANLRTPAETAENEVMNILIDKFYFYAGIIAACLASYGVSVLIPL